MRIDLFVSPLCPGCPSARAVVERFARDRLDVEVHEWDLSRDPGPAVGRGIFATPTVLLDGVHVLTGGPEASNLEAYRTGESGREDAERIPPPSKSLDVSGQ